MPDPSTISGLVARYRADSITGVASGAPVNTWPDTSGSAFTASNNGQAYGAATVPTFRAAAVNGQPAVRFTRASSQYLTSNAPTGGATQTVVAVIVPAAGATGNGGSAWRGAGGSNGLEVGSGSNGKLRNVAQYAAELGTSTRTLTTGAPAVAITTWDGAAGSTWRLNGAAAGSSATTRSLTAQGTFLGINGSALLAGNRGDPAEGFDGDLVELLTWNRVLTTAEQASVDTYVQDRYGIAVADYIPTAVAVPLSGTGTASANGVTNALASPNLSGTGSASAAGTPNPTATPTLTGAGTASGTGSLAVSVPLLLGGAGSVSASGRPDLSATAPALTGLGSVAATGSPSTSAGVLLAGEGTLSVFGRPNGLGAPLLTGSSTTTARGRGVQAGIRVGSAKAVGAYLGATRVRRIYRGALRLFP